MKMMMTAGLWARATMMATFLILGAGTAPAAAQEPPSYCSADRWDGWLGISGFTCSRCTIYTMSATEKDWSFATEPEITKVADGGPTAEVLRSGDLLVGIDGHLITSREGGQRFGAVRPGDRVTLRFRRNGQVRSATVTAAGRCLPDELPESPGAPPLLEIENALDRLPPSPAPPARLPDPPEAGSGDALAPPPLPSSDAYLGISFRCQDCRATVEDDRVVWSFARAPEITGVEAGGPADRAGLEAEDRITRVDGKPIESREGGEAFGGMSPGETTVITVSRPDGSQADVPVTPGKRPAPAAREASPSSSAGPVRYSGTVGPARITVTGGEVSVLVEEGSDLLVIRTAENEIRIRVPAREGGGGP